ncbi:MAG: hypothetical protein R3C02_16525 [Planctomycetaceae bacterium]
MPGVTNTSTIPSNIREYYELTAFFDNIDEAGLYSYFTESIPTPTLALADDATKAKLTELSTLVQQAETQLSDIAASAGNASMSGSTIVKNRSRETEERAGDSAVAQPSTLNSQPSLIPGLVKHLDFEEQLDGPNVSVPGIDGKAVK